MLLRYGRFNLSPGRAGCTFSWCGRMSAVENRPIKLVFSTGFPAGVKCTRHDHPLALHMSTQNQDDPKSVNFGLGITYARGAEREQ